MTDLAQTRGRTGAAYDGVTLLTLYVVLLFALPSRLVFAPLGAAGTPFAIVAIIGGVWWLWDRLDRIEPVPARPHTLRRAMLLFVVAVLLSYIAATVRPTSAAEMSSAEMGLLALTGWLGVFLVCNDVTERGRLDLLIRRIVLASGLVAALGVAQFFTKQAFTDLIQLPGLSTNNTLTSVQSRDGLVRPSGTAIHPIEFGVMVSALLPLALHVAMNDTAAGRVRRWFPVVAMAMAIPLSVSRSAIVGTLVAFAFVLPTWTRGFRRLAYVSIAAFSVMLAVGVPGIVSTITKLFTGISEDSSALSRTDSYALAGEFIARSPIIGRGFLTFLPEYRILDNQYLGLFIDTGILGVLALLLLFAAAVVIALRRRRRSSDTATRSLAQALAAGVAAAAVCFAFFDALSFPMLAGVTFLLVGLVAALEASSYGPVGHPRRLLRILSRRRSVGLRRLLPRPHLRSRPGDRTKV